MENVNLLPESIYQLDYSECQRIFHFEKAQNIICKGWTKLTVTSIDNCISFCEFMEKKYVEGRKSGMLPELSVVRLELELFFELKKHRRKLAGRL